MSNKRLHEVGNQENGYFQNVLKDLQKFIKSKF